MPQLMRMHSQTEHPNEECLLEVGLLLKTDVLDDRWELVVIPNHDHSLDVLGDGHG